VPGAAGRQTRPKGWQRIAVPLVAALIGSAVGSAATLASQGTASGSASQPPAVVHQVSQGSEPVTGVASVAAQVLPSVVQIDVKSRVERFFGNYVTSATGSGVIYRSDGYILTNRHVVEGADSIEVTFSDGSKASASLVGTTDNGDIGVVKVDRTGLEAATFGSSAGLHVGDLAVAAPSASRAPSPPAS
jgi:putative serine protease PepD